MDEKRKHRRIERSFMSWFRTISFVFVGRCFSKWDIVTVRNLSAGGMLFSYNDGITTGTQVNFRILFPFSAHAIKCIGRVIRNKRPNKRLHSKIFLIAAEFEKINQKDKELIRSVANDIC